MTHATHPRRAVRTALRIALCAAAFCSAFAAQSALDRAAAARPPLFAPSASSVLPAEFRSIRPAGLDGSSPPIPPSELWPAQPVDPAG